MDGPVLVNTSTREIHYFKDKTEFLIGRSVESNLDIPSQYISRKQCIIKKTPDGEWKIVNLSNLKSTLVNKLKIGDEPVTLKSGDSITFVNHLNLEHKFYKSLSDSQPNLKRKHGEQDLHCDKKKYKSEETENAELIKCRKEMSELKESYESALIKMDLIAADAKALSERNTELSKAVEECKSQTQNLESDKKGLEERLIHLEMNHQSLLLESKETSETLEDNTSEIARLLNERNTFFKEVKESRDRDSVSLFGASDLIDFVELETVKNDLAEKNELLITKDHDLAKLMEEKEQFFEQMLNSVEQEFSCCVCSDVMYEAMTLNCRHTLCKACLNEWKKKKRECPECRTKIKSETNTLTIDRFIERITPFLGESFVQKRQEMIKDRTAIKATPASSSDRNTRTPSSRSTYQGRRRAVPYRRDHGGRGRYGAASNETIDLTTPPYPGGRRNRRSQRNLLEIGQVITNREMGYYPQM